MKKKAIAALCVLFALFFSGCGEDRALTEFHDQMDAFYQSLSTSVSVLENIEPASETAVDDMLSELDTMSQLFQELSAIEIPDKYREQFENIEEFADEASAYMVEAASLYREAYADGGYDSMVADAARENYNRAMKRINYIAVLLQGRLPEDDNIIIQSEEDTVDWNGGEIPE